MAESEVTSSQRYLYYSDLHYIPEDQKNEVWAAQALIFSKHNCQRLVDAAKVKKFRDVDRGIIDPQAMKEIFDPKDGSEGGKAEFVATDWKSNPIYIHLSNITEANLEKIPLNLNCRAIDEYAKLKQQKDNDKIIMRDYYISLLNFINGEMGYPLLKNNDDPFKYIEQMQSGTPGKISGEPVGLAENIKSLIKDNESLALYNELVYKGDCEIAVELGIKHFLTINKFARKAEAVISDIRNFNMAVCQYYTDKATGEPVIDYLDIDLIRVSPFSQNDGEDITSWYIEMDITFRDFIRRFGKDMSKEQLQKIFERNKTLYAAHGLEFERCSESRRDNAKIRIGYHQFLTQNCDVYSEAVIKGNAGFKKMPFNWQPSPKTVNKYKSKRVEKHYNVWYEHYYIPLNTIADDRLSQADFDAQAEYIFNLCKVQDQKRYGEDGRLSRPSLVIWRNKRMSFAEVMDRFIPKIDFLWQQFQNDLANAMPHGMVFAEELVQLMVSTADDSAKEGKDSKLEFMKKLKQTGYGVTRMMNSDGKVVNEGKPFIEVKTGHLDTAKERLLMMMELYNMCRQSLGINPVGEGVEPKPRQSLGGIQLALDAGTSASWYMEKGYMDMVLEVGKRLMDHIIAIVNSGDSKRLQEFRDIVGAANSMALESIKDIPKHRLGLTIENINTDAAKAKLMQITEQLVSAQMLDIETLYLITKIDNYKYAVALMLMKYKQRAADAEAVKELEFNRQVQLKGMDIEFKKQDYLNQVNAESILLKLSKQMDERLETKLAQMKTEAQKNLKVMTGDNRVEENDRKIEKQEELEDKKQIFQST